MLVATLFICVNLYAGSVKLVEEMKYEVSYEKSLEKAKQSNKPIMMLIGQEYCPWCYKFEYKTLLKKNINAIVQKNFVPLTVLRGKDPFPKKFEQKGVPTVLFIDPQDESIFYKSFGYKSKKEYKIELEKAIEIFKKSK
jgi:thioredoxin-related protein